MQAKKFADTFEEFASALKDLDSAIKEGHTMLDRWLEQECENPFKVVVEDEIYDSDIEEYLEEQNQ